MNDYISTRDAHQSVSSKQAILNGMSPDGGLYVLPTLDQIHLDLSSYRLYEGRISGMC